MSLFTRDIVISCLIIDLNRSVRDEYSLVREQVINIRFIGRAIMRAIT